MSSNDLSPALLSVAMDAAKMPGVGFGLDFSVTMDVAQSAMMGSVGLNGWGGCANTHFSVDPREQLIGVPVLQLLPSGTYPMRNDLSTLVYQALID